MKTQTMLRIEAENGGRDIRSVLVDLLHKHRGRRDIVMMVAIDLQVATDTVRNWCRDLDINITEYREMVRS